MPPLLVGLGTREIRDDRCVGTSSSPRHPTHLSIRRTANFNKMESTLTAWWMPSDVRYSAGLVAFRLSMRRTVFNLTRGRQRMGRNCRHVIRIAENIISTDENTIVGCCTAHFSGRHPPLVVTLPTLQLTDNCVTFHQGVYNEKMSFERVLPHARTYFGSNFNRNWPCLLVVLNVQSRFYRISALLKGPGEFMKRRFFPPLKISIRTNLL
jgi:hypothetical protein